MCAVGRRRKKRIGKVNHLKTENSKGALRVLRVILEANRTVASDRERGKIHTHE